MGHTGQAARSRLLAGLIAFALLFGLLTVGPRIWALGHLNLFSRELTRVWTKETLLPNRDACPPGENTLTQTMAGHLLRSLQADPHASLHEGQLACLEGDATRAADLWQVGLASSFVDDPLLLLNTAIAQFPHGIVLEREKEGIGRYASRQSRSWEKENLQTALDWQEMAFAYDPTLKTGTRLAELYTKLGRSDLAAAVWKRLQALHSPEDMTYWQARAGELEEIKDWAGAMAAYLKAAAEAKSPKDTYRNYLKAGVDARRAKAWDQATEIYQRAIDLMPDKIDGYLGMGEAYRAQKRYEEAAQWFARARELFPEDHRPPYSLGLIARAQENYEDALAYFDESLALKPDNPSVLYYKAVTLDAMQRRGEAIQTLRQAITHHKTPPESWQTLLAKWQRYPDYAQDPDRWWERGRAAEQEKEWARAAAIYAEGAARAQPPDDYRLLEREALMHRYLKEWDTAAAIYEDLARRYPDKINAYLGRGEVARAQKQYEEAAQWFARAQELFPEDYRPFYYLGLTALGSKAYDQALAYFDQSLNLKPDNASALYYKAQALKALGRMEDAVSTLAQAIELHPNPPQSWKDLLEKWKETL